MRKKEMLFKHSSKVHFEGTNALGCGLCIQRMLGIFPILSFNHLEYTHGTQKHKWLSQGQTTRRTWIWTQMLLRPPTRVLIAAPHSPLLRAGESGMRVSLDVRREGCSFRDVFLFQMPAAWRVLDTVFRSQEWGGGSQILCSNKRDTKYRGSDSRGRQWQTLRAERSFLGWERKGFRLLRSDWNAGDNWKNSVQRRGNQIAAKTNGEEKGVTSLAFFFF